jgi:hypothetical protein
MINASEKPLETISSKRLKHKGGRPPQKIKRDLILRIRLSPTEAFLIKSKAREAGMRASSWIRSAAKGARIAPRWTPEEMQTLRMLSGMANNLNQLTRQANSGQLFFIARKCEGLLTEIDGTLKYLTEHDGQNSEER